MDDLFKRLERLAKSGLNDLFNNDEYSNLDSDEQAAMDELNDFLKDSHYRRTNTASPSFGAESDTSSTIPNELKKDYENLEIPFGVDFASVKEAYKKLLIKYHPDKHAGNDEAVANATEITAKLNVSYRRIESFFETGTVKA